VKQQQALNPDPTHSSTAGWDWQSLRLESLKLPLPGEPDLQARYRLQQHLEASPLGQALLEAAKHLKLVLQHQDRFTLQLGNQRWIFMRRELEGRVFLPFIQRLNRELNTLLSHAGLSVQAINQAICTGGTAALPAIARWLRQKLPNAALIQDTDSRLASLEEGKPSVAAVEPDAPGCSRIAYGLATVPLYTQVLDLPRQQYSDYFLLLELLRALPDSTQTSGETGDLRFSIGGVMQLLEHRGINTRSCQIRILALLEGHLPPGLVPSESDASLLPSQIEQQAEYHALTAAPLFEKQGNQVYRPNLRQCSLLRQYLSTITATTHQKLEEPLIANLDTQVLKAQ
jgi:hypothetical protein